MAHPLNRPRFGSGVRRDVVVEGYGILQPRVGLSLPSTNRSGYARLYGGEPGIDPYTRAVSDVYQDLFGEGSFIGKGIYDVDAFERALRDRLPENRILSHDLLEGCYARSGLLSDVAAARGIADALQRRRRAPPSLDPRRLAADRLAAPARAAALPGAPRNPLSLLSRGKIFDNLRRSLVPAALLAMLLAAWWLLPPSPVWIAVRACDHRRRAGRRRSSSTTCAVRSSPPAAASRQRRSAGEPPGAAPAAADRAVARLPAARGRVQPVDAIVRTLWRIVVTQRRLLEWRPSADVASPPPRARSPTSCTPRARWRSARCSRSPAAPGWRCCGPRRCRSRCRCCCSGCSRRSLVWWIDLPLARRTLALSAEQTRLPAPPRAPHLGVLRGACRRRRSLPAARQRAGAAGRARRPSHVADQHGLRAARRPGRARLRLPHDTRPAGRALDAHADDDGVAGALSRPLLQLVRHADAAAAAAALRLDGRQRQPRGPAADAARRAARARRRAARRRVAGSKACTTRSACCASRSTRASTRRSGAASRARSPSSTTRSRACARDPLTLAQWRSALRSLQSGSNDLLAALGAAPAAVAGSAPAATPIVAPALPADIAVDDEPAAMIEIPADDAIDWAGALLRDACAFGDELDALLPEARGRSRRRRCRPCASSPAAPPRLARRRRRARALQPDRRASPRAPARSPRWTTTSSTTRRAT